METIKTATIVLLLLAVLYGVYVVLNKPEAPPPEDVAWNQQQATEPLQVDFSGSSLATPSKTAQPGPGAAAAHPSRPADAKPTAGDRTSAPAGLPADPLRPDAAKTAGEAAGQAAAERPKSDLASASPGDVPSVPAAAPPASPTGERQAWPSTPLRPSTADQRPWPNAAPQSSTTVSPEQTSPPPPGAPPTTASQPADPAQPDGAGRPAGLSPASDRGQPGEARAGAEPIPAANADKPTAGQAFAQGPPAKPTEPGRPTSPPAAGSNGLDRVIQAAQARVKDGQAYEALFTLSLHYTNPDLTEADRQRLLDVLDPLAGKVVYSSEHLIEPAYEVRRGDTLGSIAERYNVPWQLLANINGIENPDVLVPGSKLKVVPGPFRAEVDLAGKQLTLFVGRLYAGRFPITVGSDPAPRPGEYRVNDKQPGRTYYAGDGRTIPAGDPANPYGQVWLDLGGDVCIHGSSRNDERRMGCISLSPIDAKDVYGILSKGSSVVVRR